jgi:hypothetical protein
MKAASANRKKGWLQEALGLSTGKHLIYTEKNELLTHVMLLEEYIARSGATASRKAKHKINYKRSGKFAKQKCSMTL